LLRKSFYIILTVPVFLMLIQCAGNNRLANLKEVKIDRPDKRALECFIDGVMYDIDQNYPAALLAYQEALLYDSTSSEIYFSVGRDYFMMGKVESAEIFFKKALRLDPSNGDVKRFLAEVYLRSGRLAMAENIFKDMLKSDSTRVDLYFDLAQIYLQTDRLKEAADIYSKILSMQEIPDPGILLRLGDLFLEMKRYDEAGDIYRELVRLEPEEGFGYYGVGLSREAAGDTSGAVFYYNEAISKSPDLKEAVVRLSQIYINQRKWDDALQLLNNAVRIDSSDMVSWLEIGDLQRMKGDTASSIATFKMIIDRFPQEWRSYLELGRLYLDGARYEEAYWKFKKVIELNPESYLGWLFVGISLVHLDSLEQSQSYLKKALDFEPENTLGNYYLGSVLSQLNKSEEAIYYFEQVLKRRPNWVAVLGALAGEYERLKKYSIADSLFRRAIKLDSSNALVLNNYAYSLSVRGIRLDEALRMVKRALESEPENGAYLDTIGWIYFKMGRYEDALKYIKQAFMVRDTSAEVAEHLGDVYEKLGMKDKAVELWKKALELDRNNLEIQKKIERNR